MLVNFLDSFVQILNLLINSEIFYVFAYIFIFSFLFVFVFHIFKGGKN